MNLTLLSARVIDAVCTAILALSLIRFDFLDTMGGGNLSLVRQTRFIRQHFGMQYTHRTRVPLLLDAGDDASVYLGLKARIDREAMIRELSSSRRRCVVQCWGTCVNRYGGKHDHFLIPAGTIHCPGNVVLEIAQLRIFHIQVVGLGQARLDGSAKTDYLEQLGKRRLGRDTEWVGKNLINQLNLWGRPRLCARSARGSW